MTTIELAILAIIEQYGSIDGSHHKQWVLDQIVRTILTKDQYDEWVADTIAEGFEWDTGISP